MRRASLLLGLVTAAGCAAGPRFDKIEAEMPRIPRGHGRIFIYRPGAVAPVIQPNIHVNDKVVGIAYPDGFVFVDQPTGKCEVKCAKDTEHVAKFNLFAGQRVYIRIRMKGFGIAHAEPEVVPPDAGLAGVRRAYLATAWPPPEPTATPKK